MTGVYVGFGANLAAKTGTAPDTDPAIGILFGNVFSVGMYLIIIY